MTQRVPIAEFDGLLPLFDPKRVNKPYVVEGRNVLVDAEGPRSAFGHTNYAFRMAADYTGFQSFRIRADAEVFIFLRDGIYQFDDTAGELIPVYLFGFTLSDIHRWTYAVVGGKHYFARRGIGLLQYEFSSNLWTVVSGGDVPTGIVACAEAGGRLFVLSDDVIARSVIDEGTDFTPDIATGAGAQSLAIINGGYEGHAYTVFSFAGGVLVYTAEGILLVELISAIVPVRHRVLTHDHVLFNPYCVIPVGKREQRFLTRAGLYNIVDGGTPEPWQPAQGEFLKSIILPNLSPEKESLVRLCNCSQRLWFMIAIASNQTPGVYTITYVLYEPAQKWGVFNTPHAGMGVMAITAGQGRKFRLGFMDLYGSFNYFDDANQITSTPDLLDPTVLYYHPPNEDFPPRNEGGTLRMPAWGRGVTWNEYNFSQSPTGFGFYKFTDTSYCSEARRDVTLDLAPRSVVAVTTQGADYFRSAQNVATTTESNLLIVGRFKLNTEPGTIAQDFFSIGTQTIRLSVVKDGAVVVFRARMIVNGETIDLSTPVTYPILTDTWYLYAVRISSGAGGSAQLHIENQLGESSGDAVTISDEFDLAFPLAVLGNYSGDPNRPNICVADIYVHHSCHTLLDLCDPTDLLLFTEFDQVTQEAIRKCVAHVVADFEDALFVKPDIALRWDEGSNQWVNEGAQTPFALAPVLNPNSPQICDDLYTYGALHTYGVIYRAEGEGYASICVLNIDYPADPVYEDLNAYVKLGPIRYSKDADLDELSTITETAVSSLDADNLEETVIDYMDDYPPIDITVDWNTETGLEDWGFGLTVTANYETSWQGTIDGRAVWQNMNITPEQVSVHGNVKYFASTVNGLYNFVTIATAQAGDSFHIKTLEARVFHSGRLT